MLKFMSSFANIIVRPLLRSRLHSLISQHVMLITFTGRKSGKVYTIPVGYVRADEAILTSTLRSNRWWKNLCGGAPVTLYLQGRELKGSADVVNPRRHAWEAPSRSSLAA
jgi:hypothetical protein